MEIPTIDPEIMRLERIIIAYSLTEPDDALALAREVAANPNGYYAQVGDNFEPIPISDLLDLKTPVSVHSLLPVESE